jgi:hypothetical protein
MKKKSVKSQTKKTRRKSYEVKPLIHQHVTISQLMTVLAMAHQKYGDMQVICTRGGQDTAQMTSMTPCLAVVNSALFAAEMYRDKGEAYGTLYLQGDLTAGDFTDGADTEIVGVGMLEELVRRGKIKDWRKDHGE